MSDHDSDLVIVETFEDSIVARFLQDVLLDPIQVEQVSRQLRGALQAADPANLVISLESVTQLSSLMLSVLIALRSEAEARGGKVVLAAIPDRVDYLLKLTNLAKAFPSFLTTEEALASFR
ncbi:MAG: STAS domain-containing protein [Planctomycetota bacterium]|nr:STAS domain-containing protein [Planctomycetota bacterium]